MKLFLIILILIGMCPSALTQPIALHPDNPHYFFYKVKPVVLISSAEHYGIIINSELDYKNYLDVLQKHEFNLTRVFSGAYLEGSYYDFNPGKTYNWKENQNTLAVRPEKLLAPWARSNEKGYSNGGNKFDLDQWDPAYFKRLKDFCKEAEQRGVIVEFAFFSANYGPVSWSYSPLYGKNNINDTSTIAYNEIHLPSHKNLRKRQMELVKKIVSELNELPNLYFEICNEPYWLKGIPEVDSTIKSQQFLPEIEEWQRVMAAVVTETEKGLPNKHLVGQNFANKNLKITDLNSSVSVLNFHYATPPVAVADNYHLNRPIAFDETSQGTSAPSRRREAWAFILAGGAVYDNLDFSFATDDLSGLGRNPNGERHSGYEVRSQLQILVRVINHFDFIKSKPIDSILFKQLPTEVKGYGLSITNQDYLVYFMKTGAVEMKQWQLQLQPGNYNLTWTDPLNGQILKTMTVGHLGGALEIKFPNFGDDLLLRLQKMK